MYKLSHKYYFFSIALFLLVSILGLWSWNTLSELLNLPQAQYKHVLAAIFLLLILKWSLFSRYHTIGGLLRGNHDHSNP